jgi:hypothetical protein
MRFFTYMVTVNNGELTVACHPLHREKSECPLVIPREVSHFSSMM